MTGNSASLGFKIADEKYILIEYIMFIKTVSIKAKL